MPSPKHPDWVWEARRVVLCKRDRYSYWALASRSSAHFYIGKTFYLWTSVLHGSLGLWWVTYQRIDWLKNYRLRIADLNVAISSFVSIKKNGGVKSGCFPLSFAIVKYWLSYTKLLSKSVITSLRSCWQFLSSWGTKDKSSVYILLQKHFQFLIEGCIVAVTTIPYFISPLLWTRDLFGQQLYLSHPKKASFY